MNLTHRSERFPAAWSTTPISRKQAARPQLRRTAASSAGRGADALRRLGVRHHVGGSVASAFHGAIRPTVDVDLICDLREGQGAAFCEAFGDEFYVSRSAVEDAIRRESCFNMIHLPTAYKVDVFLSRGRPFDLVLRALAREDQRPHDHDE